MWNAAQYMKFGEERTQPCRDLVNRILLAGVRSVMDLGCGPGNSTAVLRERWPAADITGLDSSPEMIAAARESQPGGRWILDDLEHWAAAGAAGNGAFDLIFSNATLHWVSDHQLIFPRLLARTGGALAVQMPSNVKAAAFQLVRELAASSRWRQFYQQVRDWQAHEMDFYYDLLSPLAAHLVLWSTEYVHVMSSPDAIVEWYKGTGLRPFLEALPDASHRAQFTAEYLAEIRTHYPPQPDGRVLFPFRRTFLVAYK